MPSVNVTSEVNTIGTISETELSFSGEAIQPGMVNEERGGMVGMGVGEAVGVGVIGAVTVTVTSSYALNSSSLAVSRKM